MRTSGKVLKDFENLRKSLFDEEISHMAFVRDGKVEILYTQKYVDKLEQETERLNNIINELEKTLEEEREKDRPRDDYNYGVGNTLDYIWYKLQELKGEKQWAKTMN